MLNNNVSFGYNKLNMIFNSPRRLSKIVKGVKIEVQVNPSISTSFSLVIHLTINFLPYLDSIFTLIPTQPSLKAFKDSQNNVKLEKYKITEKSFELLQTGNVLLSQKPKELRDLQHSSSFFSSRIT